ncbi:MAG: SDR family NAD(P)-dependent oxidoreductase [Gulosibacter sp.]|uniref:SDR family NAD(P)-dependent oxidoreductase n=1 Tax=Gulosibacter sp. TaxID=2817531 RepID=UPI003F9071D6
MTQPHAGSVIVTGAASGMGRATAEYLLAQGRRVIALDVAPFTTEVAGEFVSVVADVRDRAALERVLADAVDEHGISGVANIAGIYPPSTLDSYDEELYRRVFDINVLGVVNVIAAAKPYMSEGSGVVNFTSVDAYTVSPGQLMYGASKAAVSMLTKELALELAPEGIRVNGIAPGWVATPGNAATGRMAAVADSIPLGRVAQPEEIARWVGQLTDPAFNSFMTGEVVVLSGGAVIR